MRKFTLVLFLLFLSAGQVLKAQLVINEVLALNSVGEINPVSGEQSDWIEIYNGSSGSVDLSGYFLSDDSDNLNKWRFPDPTSIPAGSYHMVWADGTNDTLNGSYTNFKLGVTGETLYLLTPDGILSDSLEFPRMYEDVSYGLDHEGYLKFFSVPSPGEQNNSTYSYLVSHGVTMNPPAAIYSSAIQVTIIPEVTGGTIRYTVDGSPPDLSDAIYSSPISVTENEVIRARLWEEGMEPGDISTSSYIISDGFTIPVVSLVTDPPNMFDETIGIYVEGTNGIAGFCTSDPKNWNQDWERPMSLEFFDLGGIREIQSNCGVKIHGACTRLEPMKSLGLFARSKYGDNRFNHQFFPGKNIDEFKGLLLRNGGNDFRYAFMRDPLGQALVGPNLNVDMQAHEMVQVFLNGEYWGIHHLREKVNEHWVTSNYGVPDENMDFIQDGRELYTGSLDAYNNMIQFLENNSLESNANYDVIAGQIDIDSYIDYLITEMFFANRDWPGNNQKCWRDYVADTKWRWILFDLDFSMINQNFNMFNFATEEEGEDWPNPPWSTLPIRRLLENDGFTERFVQKYAMHLNTTLAPDPFNHVIDSFYNKLQDILPAHIQRWGYPISMEDWNQQVDAVRQFADRRSGIVWQNMKNFFALGSPILLNIESPGESGQILANGIKIPMEGIDGQYFPGVSLDLEFESSPGYSFKQWEAISSGPAEQALLPRNSIWKYSDSGIIPVSDWINSDFDDSAWSQGDGQLGYGDSDENTEISFGSDAANKHITYYFRHEFQIEDISLLNDFTLKLLRDDGALVYINGSEALRDNMPTGDILFSTMASMDVGEADEDTYFEFSLDKGFFKSGLNQIAVEVHQQSPDNPDLSFDLELHAFLQVEADTVIYVEPSITLQPTRDLTVKAVTEHSPERSLDLYINEFMASNSGAFQDVAGEDDDWIEIFNNGDAEVDMAGLYFTDDLTNPTKWMIPEGFPDATTIGAKDFLVFFADGEIVQGPRHLDFKLSAGGEDIGLSFASGSSTEWIDSIRFGPQITNVSFGRFPDGGLAWKSMNSYTPQSSNIYTSSPLFKIGEPEFLLYPNPASDRLYVKIRNTSNLSLDEMVYNVYDLTGRKVLIERRTSMDHDQRASLDVSGLPEGIYVLVLESGQFVLNGKFIVTR